MMMDSIVIISTLLNNLILDICVDRMFNGFINSISGVGDFVEDDINLDKDFTVCSPSWGVGVTKYSVVVGNVVHADADFILLRVKNSFITTELSDIFRPGRQIVLSLGFGDLPSIDSDYWLRKSSVKFISKLER